MMLVAQVLVLALTALLWALAKCDLRAQKPVDASSQYDRAEWQRLHDTMEAVLVSLEARIAALERKTEPMPRPPEPSAREPSPGKGDLLLPEAAQYAPLYMLVDAGVTDPEDIARRTGLTRGEIELALGLRARRML